MINIAMRARDIIFKEAPTLDDQQEIINNRLIRRLQNMLHPLANIDNACLDPRTTLSPEECAKNSAQARDLSELVRAEIEELEINQAELTARRDIAMKRAGRKQARLIDAKSDKELFDQVQKLVKRFSENLGANNTYVLSIRSIFEMKNLQRDEVKAFVDDAVEGTIIDMEKLTSTSTGKIRDHVNPKHLTVWDAVGEDFMGIKDPNATRGSIGPAEIAFILLGSPVDKANKGDLIIGTEPNAKVYEVKASKQSTSTNAAGKTSTSRSGGRLTADSMPKNNTIRFAIWDSLTEYFLIDDPKESKNFSLGQRGLGLLNNWSAQWATKSRKGPTVRRARVIKFLETFMKTTMPGFKTRTKPTASTIVEKMVEKDGSVDTGLNGKFMRHYMLANFIEYRGAGQGDQTHDTGKLDKNGNPILKTIKGSQAHFDALLFVNSTTMNYLIIKSGRAFVKALTPGANNTPPLIKITSGATFTEAQNPAAPQLYTF